MALLKQVYTVLVDLGKGLESAYLRQLKEMTLSLRFEDSIVLFKLQLNHD